MGMLSETEVFQALVRRGEMVQVGRDANGQPLYISKEAQIRPFKWLDHVQSRALHHVVQRSGYGFQDFSGFK